jgi:hypothetical protein
MFAGIVVMFAGALLLTGSLFARIVAIAVVAISAIGNFWSIPYYPVWHILMLALDIAIIWAISTYSHWASGDV